MWILLRPCRLVQGLCISASLHHSNFILLTCRSSLVFSANYSTQQENRRGGVRNFLRPRVRVRRLVVGLHYGVHDCRHGWLTAKGDANQNGISYAHTGLGNGLDHTLGCLRAQFLINTNVYFDSDLHGPFNRRSTLISYILIFFSCFSARGFKSVNHNLAKDKGHKEKTEYPPASTTVLKRVLISFLGMDQKPFYPRRHSRDMTLKLN